MAWTHVHSLCRDVILNVLVASPLLLRPFRWRILRFLGMDVAKSAISASCWFGGRDVSIGHGTFVNIGCLFDVAAPIRIGSNNQVGMQVTFVTSSHEVGGADKRGARTSPSAIAVGDGCWIGARATILPGVTIGNGVVIGAGSVVTRDCISNGLYAGVPAKRIRTLLAVD